MITMSLDLQMTPYATLLKFDKQIPVYNWYYPFESDEHKIANTWDIYEELVDYHPRRRALYFHIPFCETICSFCPFVRASYKHEDEIESYVQALLNEIKRKHQFATLANQPIDTIYFGGGTPSLLEPDQIRRLGEAIHHHFDTSNLQEFTFECEVKSVTLEKLQAMCMIGVNRISFGAQTLNPKYREIFDLTATVEQIQQVAAWTNERFQYTNMDLLYGMAGQTLDELIADIDGYLALGTTSIDCYPLNNASTQRKLHQAFREAGLNPLSANTKLSYRIFLNEYLRAQGYVPINGYSYTKQTPETRDQRVVVQHTPTFRYHDIVYGYGDECWDGYGSGAVSMFGSRITENIANRAEYMDRLLGKSDKPWFNAWHGLDDAEKGIVYFPYRGTLDKRRIEWERVNAETRETLDLAVKQGLAVDKGEWYEVTEAGWFNYVDLEYMLMPRWHRQQLANIIDRAFAQGRERDDEQVYNVSPLMQELIPLPTRATP
ncbi:MAG TPA: radical SAM protein [Ktedonosporobacter sp.]|jgi:oxygen-independent coproporphyrinogen-3 oxidase|nr:radical SAM protein [Ktedonosporobacter sp.]